MWGFTNDFLSLTAHRFNGSFLKKDETYSVLTRKKGMEGCGSIEQIFD
jgi:hypothetical protein